MNTHNYIIKSLELHLFFGRIMKEHSLFLKAGFTPVNSQFSVKAEFYKNEFENLLNQAVLLSDGVISESVINSGEIVTEFTAIAEKQTEMLTGIGINRDITIMEQRLTSGNSKNLSGIYRQVRALNQTALTLLNGLILLKESILRNVLSCKMFTMNYPLLIEHILREARLYREYVQMLERTGNTSGKSMKDIECFWNRIMMEHALFIRGLLDPSETQLFNSADEFAKEYSDLLQNSCDAQDRVLNMDSLNQTIKFRDFKAAGTEGIENCKIRSLILPLLADHVLREANHFIRILED